MTKLLKESLCYISILLLILSNTQAIQVHEDENEGDDIALSTPSFLDTSTTAQTVTPSSPHATLSTSSESPAVLVSTTPKYSSGEQNQTHIARR